MGCLADGRLDSNINNGIITHIHTYFYAVALAVITIVTFYETC